MGLTRHVHVINNRVIAFDDSAVYVTTKGVLNSQSLVYQHLCYLLTLSPGCGGIDVMHART